MTGLSVIALVGLRVVSDLSYVTMAPRWSTRGWPAGTVGPLQARAPVLVLTDQVLQVVRPMDRPSGHPAQERFLHRSPLQTRVPAASVGPEWIGHISGQATANQQFQAWQQPDGSWEFSAIHTRPPTDPDVRNSRIWLFASWPRCTGEERTHDTRLRERVALQQPTHWSRHPPAHWRAFSRTPAPGRNPRRSGLSSNYANAGYSDRATQAG